MTLQRQPWLARTFEWATAFADTLQALPNRMVPAPFRLMQIGSAFWHSRALQVAVRLDLATVLADEHLTAQELAARVDADPDALLRLLRLLAALGVFTIDADRRIRNNTLSQPLRADRPGGVRHMILMHNSPEMSRPWFETLEAGIRQGRPPFEIRHGQDLYAYMDAHPDFDALFARAMDEVEALSGDSFATAFDWRAFDRVIDVGGSRGAKSRAILRRHPHLRAVVADRPQVIRQARQQAAELRPDAAADDCRDRLSFVEGDVLGALPAATGPRDAYLLSAVFHGFDDATSEQALRNLAAAAGPVDARIVLLELVVAQGRSDLTSASFDLQMFMGTRGRERSLAEWQALFARSGVELVEVVHLASFGKLLVLRAGVHDRRGTRR